MISLFGYKFEDNKACLVCGGVFAGETIKVIVHDDDGWLQFLNGNSNPNPDNAKTVALSELIKRHSFDAFPAELERGYFATLEADESWKIHRIQ